MTVLLFSTNGIVLVGLMGAVYLVAIWADGITVRALAAEAEAKKAAGQPGGQKPEQSGSGSQSGSQSQEPAAPLLTEAEKSQIKSGVISPALAARLLKIGGVTSPKIERGKTSIHTSPKGEQHKRTAAEPKKVTPKAKSDKIETGALGKMYEVRNGRIVRD